MQVKALERSLCDSTQRLQQLQLRLEQSEEQAAMLQTQASDRVQRLQVMHAEALNMRQQEVILIQFSCMTQYSCAIKFCSRYDLAAADYRTVRG